MQEVFGARQATQTNLNISVSPTAGNLVSAPQPIEAADIVLPNAQAPDSKLGPAFGSQIKNTTTRDQLTTGLDLLYLGDSQLLDEGKRVVLLRFDVSINNYLEATNFWGDRLFAVTGFQVRSPDVPDDEDIVVYTLAPEYASVLAKESLATANLESYAAQGGGTAEGFDIQGAGRFQRALEELFSTLTDHPIQFASYDNKPNRFAFAFGPRRKIEKRSWIDPRRIFGNTYQINYEIEPGPRDVYALVILPCHTKTIVVDRVLDKSFFTRGFSKIFADLDKLNSEHLESEGEPLPPKNEDGSGHDDKKVITGKAGNTASADDKLGWQDSALANSSGTSLQIYQGKALTGIIANSPRKTQQESKTLAFQILKKPHDQEDELGVFKKLPFGLATDDAQFLTSAVINLGYKCFPQDMKPKGWPEEIYPKTTSSIYITGLNISSETEVRLDNTPIPKVHTHFQGRNRLKIDFPPNAHLKAKLEKHLKSSPGVPLKVKLAYVTPGMPQPSPSIDIELKDSGPANKASYSISPEHGVVGTHVKLTAKHSPIDFRHAQNIIVGGNRARIIPGLKKKE